MIGKMKMPRRRVFLFGIVVLFCASNPLVVFSQQTVPSADTVQEVQPPAELAVIKASVGIWDAEFEVWPQGVDADSIKFQGSETVRAFGEYWIASDLSSEFGGQTMTVHSIVGFDLAQQKLVGTVIDQGPYAASMSGEYDADANSVTWTTEAKSPDGTVMIQKSVMTHPNENERNLVLSVPDADGNETKFMEVHYVRREQ